ncbi:hypothetical protein R3L02_41930 [Streptomyces scabiei]|uniref:hypothetical protein n=1 Tax=Streptomyces scabiei TaxID=1930 RepID=UPI00298EEB40|nr:hypothetical protein [Streptomyces scabiei]MDW8478311.1 hypothetical protein [Streptomyces scabiei]
MAQRFENAGLVLGPVDGRSAALCRFAGRPGAERNRAALAVVDAALDIAEQVEGVDDVRQLMGLWQAAHVWGHPGAVDVPGLRVELPQLGEANTVVAGRLQHLLEQLTPEQLRELGIALSVNREMVALALELAEEEAAGGRESRAETMEEVLAEELLNDDRIGDAVDVLLLEAPDSWPPLQRAGLTLALVWDLADLIACAAQLSVEDSLPAALLWQASGADHICASVRVPVPETDLLVWAKVDSEPFDGRTLWSQAAPLDLWGWSLDWEREDGSKVYYKGGRSPSQTAARWKAQWATQKLLTDPDRAKSPATGEPLIIPR